MNDRCDSIYLDHNATTPIDPRVVEAMQWAYNAYPGNASSQHRAGRLVRQQLDDAAEQLAEGLGARTNRADADRWIFTSGGTEANNLAIRGLLGPAPGRLIVSSIEHPSVLETAEFLRGTGWQVDLVRATERGDIELSHLAELLAVAPPPRLVSVMLANNETGVIQPLPEVVRLCQPLGIRVHTDAVQAVGKLPLSFTELAVTAMTVTAHKLHGPAGIGGLLLKSGIHLQPLLFGGAQQLGWRPGTEPTALAIGFQKALQLYLESAEAHRSHLRARRDQLEQGLLARHSNIVIHGFDAERLPHTSCLSFPGRDRQSLLMQLDLAGVYCSSGSACASGSSQPSHVLLAMGVKQDLVESALRLSVGLGTTEEAIDEAVERISRVLD